MLGRDKDRFWEAIFWVAVDIGQAQIWLRTGSGHEKDICLGQGNFGTVYVWNKIGLGQNRFGTGDGFGLSKRP